MAIVESGFIRPANSKPAFSAIARGRPICMNMMRGVWKLISPLNAGEGTKSPLRLLLPCSHSAIAARLVSESLRSSNSMSLLSITTSTLKRSLVRPGISAPGPPTTPSITSVGEGTASTSTERLGSASVVGILAATSAGGSRSKYGRP